ncbi:MAG: Holliday junction resolvase RuvX [Nitrospinota bacterium]
MTENTRSGRILGVDLGSRRIGLALSDPLGLTAQPLPTLQAEAWDADVENVARIAAERQAEAVVVGLPLRMNGTAGPEARRAERFAEALREKTRLPVHTWDERLTTVESERALIAAGVRRKKRRAAIDSAASLLILQGFLDRRRSQSSA